MSHVHCSTVKLTLHDTTIEERQKVRTLFPRKCRDGITSSSAARNHWSGFNNLSGVARGTGYIPRPTARTFFRWRTRSKRRLSFGSVSGRTPSESARTLLFIAPPEFFFQTTRRSGRPGRCARNCRDFLGSRRCPRVFLFPAEATEGAPRFRFWNDASEYRVFSWRMFALSSP